MPRQRRLLRNQPARGASRLAALRSSYAFRPRVEELESRRMLAGYFDNIATEVAGPTGAIANITLGLGAISSLGKLPIINANVEDIDEITNSLNAFRISLRDKLLTLDPGQATDAARDAIKDGIILVLGPSGAKVLADRATPVGVGPEDITISTFTTSSIDIKFDLNK